MIKMVWLCIMWNGGYSTPPVVVRVGDQASCHVTGKAYVSSGKSNIGTKYRCVRVNEPA